MASSASPVYCCVMMMCQLRVAAKDYMQVVTDIITL